MPGASPVRHNVDAFLDHSDDYKLDDVEAKLHNIHKEFIQFKERMASKLSSEVGKHGSNSGLKLQHFFCFLFQ